MDSQGCYNYVCPACAVEFGECIYYIISLGRLDITIIHSIVTYIWDRFQYIYERILGLKLS